MQCQLFWFSGNTHPSSWEWHCHCDCCFCCCHCCRPLSLLLLQVQTTWTHLSFVFPERYFYLLLSLSFWGFTHDTLSNLCCLIYTSWFLNIISYFPSYTTSLIPFVSCSSTYTCKHLVCLLLLPSFTVAVAWIFYFCKLQLNLYMQTFGVFATLTIFTVAVAWIFVLYFECFQCLFCFHITSQALLLFSWRFG